MPRNSKKLSTYANIADRFEELLYRQFPVNRGVPINLRTPSDFAAALHVHVNHLNRALRAVRGKTTTEAINEEFLLESKRLLVRTDWRISKISIALGFREPHHFSAFFKKHEGMTPSGFRLIQSAR